MQKHNEQLLLPQDEIIPNMCADYNYVIMRAMASQITSLTIVYSTVHSRADKKKHQNSASLAFVWGLDWLGDMF